MSVTVINSLLNTPDNFELVRDQIAAILVANVANQMALAEAANEDPDDWKLRVFTERSNPFEEFLNVDPQNSEPDTSPLVNIWFDSQSFDRRRGTVNTRQQCDATFNIDVYGYGVSVATEDGHEPSDKSSAIEAQRAMRLVRQILMADINTYLGLPRGKEADGYFSGRWVENIQSFQPEIDQRPAENVQGMRMTLNTSFNEWSPQYVNETLELIDLTVLRKENGEIYFEQELDFT